LKKIISFFAASALCGVAFAASITEPVELTKDQIESITKKFPSVFTADGQVKLVKGLDRGNFKQIQIEISTPQGSQRVESYIFDSTPDVIIAGAAYDSKGEKIALPLNNEVIEKGVAVTMGKGSEIIYLVTDPECPYCQMLEKSITPKTLEKYTIKVIPMPLSFHPKAVPMLYWVFDAPKDQQAARLSKVLNGDEEYQKFTPSAELKTKVDAIVKAGYKAAEELSAQGTPMLFDSKFTPIDPSLIIIK